jgi:hypothetical protein
VVEPAVARRQVVHVALEPLHLEALEGRARPAPLEGRGREVHRGYLCPAPGGGQRDVPIAAARIQYPLAGAHPARLDQPFGGRFQAAGQLGRVRSPPRIAQALAGLHRIRARQPVEGALGVELPRQAREAEP